MFGLKVENLKWVWLVALLIIFALNGLIWEGMALALKEQGVGQEGAQVLGFVTARTLPLAVATVATILFLREALKSSLNIVAQISVVAAIVWGSAWIGNRFYVGVLDPGRFTGLSVGGAAQIPVRYLSQGISAYLTSYGLAMFLSGFTVGIAAIVSILVLLEDQA